MKFTQLTRKQLIAFSVVTVLSLVYALWNYGGLQQTTGIGTYTVRAEFSDASGLYARAIVTYRGSDVGVVKNIDVSPAGAVATLQLDSDHRIPRDLVASVLSVSAIGEQYVDLVPRTDKGPYLSDGYTIPIGQTKSATSVNTLMHNADELLRSVPQDDLRSLIDDSHRTLAGTGPALRDLIGSAQRFVHLAQGSLPQTTALIRDGEPVLDALNSTATSITRYTTDLASFTEQLTVSDGYLRVLLAKGPAFANTLADTFEENQRTLPLLLGDLQAVGQVLKVYVPALRQILVIYPALASSVNYATRTYQRDDDLLKAQAGLDVKLGNTLIPPPCTNGYQGTQRRDPSDTTDGDSAYGARCELPKTDPRAVRGSRNLPCITNPRVRTADAQNCPGGPPSRWPQTRSAAIPEDPKGSDDPKTPRSRQRATAPTTATASYDPASGRVLLADGSMITVPGLARGVRLSPDNLEALMLGGTR